MYKIFVNPFRIQEVTSLRTRNIQTSVQADSKDENLNYFAKKISRVQEKGNLLFEFEFFSS